VQTEKIANEGRGVVEPSAFLHFDDMTWPNPEDPLMIEWKLRHGEPTKNELMVAASMIAAYKQLVYDTVARRNAKVRGIRAAQS
jgi:hypothetical protein